MGRKDLPSTEMGKAVTAHLWLLGEAWVRPVTDTHRPPGRGDCGATGPPALRGVAWAGHCYFECCWHVDGIEAFALDEVTEELT